MKLDIVIPVYNEGDGIVPVLKSFKEQVKTPFRVLICYDHDDDTTLPALESAEAAGIEIVKVKNQGKGAHGAVTTGFAESDADAVIVMPADDDYNAGILDAMAERCGQGADIVCASRFIKGGCMEGCRWLKAVLVRTAAFTLRHLGRMPTHDATNGFRLFSRRLLDSVEIESTEGFCYSIELLVKCHRLGWRVDQVPARWFERKAGTSRFRIFKWAPLYLRWYFYGFATTYLFKRASTVKLKAAANQT